MVFKSYIALIIDMIISPSPTCVLLLQDYPEGVYMSLVFLTVYSVCHEAWYRLYELIQ